MEVDMRTCSIMLPSRGRDNARMRGGRRAYLETTEHDGCKTRLELPFAVGRALERQQKAGLLDMSDIETIRKRCDELSWQCARDRVSALLDRREYSAVEVRAKLLRDGYDAGVCDEIVGRAVRAGLIDDARYADILIRSRMTGGWGRGRIEHDLTSHGIDPASIDGWPDTYFDEEGEEERALSVARTKRLAAHHGYEKLVRFLSGRGFTLAISMRVAHQVVDEANGD